MATVTITTEGDQFIAAFQYDPELVAAIRSVPGRRFDPDRKRWTLPRSPTVASAMCRALENIAAMNPDAGFVAAVEQGEAETSVHSTAIKGKDLPPPPSKTESWRQQREAFHFSAPRAATYLAMKMGNGKSKVAVDLCNQWNAQRVLIVCPKSVIPAWRKQFALHSLATDFNVVLLDTGSAAKRAEQVKAAARSGQRFVIVTNYESIIQEVMGKALLAIEWDALVADEAHRIKAPGGKQSKVVAALAKRSKRKLMLSGTPAPHSPMDVYAQFRALDPGIFGTSFAAFRARYAVMGGYLNKQILRFQNLDDLRDRMFRAMYQCDENTIELPPVHTITTPVTISPSARALYAKLEADLIAGVEGGTVTASNALALLLRLQQVANGVVPVDVANDVDRTVSREARRVCSAKADALEDILDGLPAEEPVVIFGRFHADLDICHEVAQRLGRKSLELSGRRSELADWQNGAAPVLVVQLKSGGAGIDLTRACYCVYYSLNFSWDDYQQSMARVHRPGQTRPTTYYQLTATQTIDEKIVKVLAARGDLVRSLMDEGLLS